MIDSSKKVGHPTNVYNSNIAIIFCRYIQQMGNLHYLVFYYKGYVSDYNMPKEKIPLFGNKGIHG